MDRNRPGGNQKLMPEVHIFPSVPIKHFTFSLISLRVKAESIPDSPTYHQLRVLTVCDLSYQNCSFAHVLLYTQHDDLRRRQTSRRSS
jgi:hypothetical protein